MRKFICGVVSTSGTFGEPLACGFPPHSSGHHAWASLPTYLGRGQAEWSELCARAAALGVAIAQFDNSKEAYVKAIREGEDQTGRLAADPPGSRDREEP